MLEYALFFAERLSRVAAWAGGALLLLSAGLISVEVVLRKAFALSIGGADELSSYALAIGSSWAFAYALFRKAHVRVDVLYTRLPLQVRAALDVVSLALLSTITYLLARHGYEVFNTSLQRQATANTPLQTPLWIPQGLWFTGLVWFALATALLFVRTAWALARGHWKTVQHLAGTSTLEQELTELSRPGSDR